MATPLVVARRSYSRTRVPAPVQVVEEARQPPNHHFVVVPALQQLPQQKLVAVEPQRGQHLRGAHPPFSATRMSKAAELRTVVV